MLCVWCFMSVIVRRTKRTEKQIIANILFFLQSCTMFCSFANNKLADCELLCN